ncbi:MAG: AAA family ATPase, partial [Planctomycetota bacterium]
MAIGRIISGRNVSLRPKYLNECIGQKNVKEKLSIAITAARQRSEPLEHILFYGPPGLGKTTLAHVVANEMEANIRCSSGPALVKQGDVMGLLSNISTADILFVDEVHRL